jgi:hypothetical protein
MAILISRHCTPNFPRATECVLLLYNVFSYYGMCSLTIEYVLTMAISRSREEERERERERERAGQDLECVHYRMCSLTIECVLLL